MLGVSLVHSLSTKFPSNVNYRSRKCFKWQRRFCSRYCIAAQASNKDRDNPNVDWDTAWSDFKRNVTSQLPEVESNVTTQAPRFAKQRSREWNIGQRQDEIKSQERFFLNYWSQDTFFKSGGALVIVFFVIMILIAGPPPSDGRCTLPWC